MLPWKGQVTGLRKFGESLSGPLAGGRSRNRSARTSKPLFGAPRPGNSSATRWTSTASSPDSSQLQLTSPYNLSGVNLERSNISFRKAGTSPSASAPKNR